MKRFMMASLMVVFVAAGYGQGMYWESTVTVSGQTQNEKMLKTFYLPKKMKTTSEGESEYMIIRLDQEKMYTVNPAEKTYTETTFAQMEAAGKQMEEQMAAQMAKLQEQMKDMPPEQRKMMEGMLGPNAQSKAGGKYDVVKTADKKVISGFPCTRFAMKQDDKEIASIWVTQEVPGFATMKQDMMEQMGRMSSFKGIGDAMKKVDGFPIEMDMAMGVKTLVTKVERRTLGAGEFEIPAGFTKTERTEKHKKSDR